MPTKKKPASTTDKVRKEGERFLKEGNARSVIIRGNDGRQYVHLNALVALILAILLWYVALVILIVHLFGGLQIEIIKKEEKKVAKKRTASKKTSAKKNSSAKTDK